MINKRLCKSRKNKMIGGVCGGISEFFGIDPTIVRVIAGVLCLLKGVGILIYLVACIVMPYDDEDFSDVDAENLKSANINPEEEKKSKDKNSSSEKNEKLHSDEDFDSYFKK